MTNPKIGLIFRENNFGDVIALHSTYGDQRLYNPDGIRCWLPCIDSASNRAVFDIIIISPINFTIQSSGCLVSNNIIYKNQLEQDEDDQKKDIFSFYNKFNIYVENQIIKSKNMNSIDFLIKFVFFELF